MNYTTSRMTGKFALALLLSVNTASMFGMLRSVKRFSPARIKAMHYSRARRLMHKIVPTISMQKSLMHSQINHTKEELEKKLERLTNQLKLCTSFRHKEYKGWRIFSSGLFKDTIDHPSMWQPNENQVKQRCDKDFAQWIKVRQELEQFEREQE